MSLKHVWQNGNGKMTIVLDEITWDNFLEGCTELTIEFADKEAVYDRKSIKPIDREN